jgi:hypothetical protein
VMATSDNGHQPQTVDLTPNADLLASSVWKPACKA